MFTEVEGDRSVRKGVWDSIHVVEVKEESSSKVSVCICVCVCGCVYLTVLVSAGSLQANNDHHVAHGSRQGGSR
jgi:hypothetical protein